MAIQDDFHNFWRSAKDSMRYKLRGTDFSPETVSTFGIQLTEGDYGDDFNFKCQSLNLRILANGVERPYSAEFIIKVVPIVKGHNQVIEKVVSIKDNCIYLQEI